jgi:hypothetical protein
MDNILATLKQNGRKHPGRYVDCGYGAQEGPPVKDIDIHSFSS